MTKSPSDDRRRLTKAELEKVARIVDAWGKLRKWLEVEASNRTGNYGYVIGVVLGNLDSLLSEED